MHPWGSIPRWPPCHERPSSTGGSLVSGKDQVLRAWSKGLDVMPPSIRVDPAGHICTPHAATSLVRKFSPVGDLPQTFAVGGRPLPVPTTSAVPPIPAMNPTAGCSLPTGTPNCPRVREGSTRGTWAGFGKPFSLERDGDTSWLTTIRGSHPRALLAGCGGGGGPQFFGWPRHDISSVLVPLRARVLMFLAPGPWLRPPSQVSEPVTEGLSLRAAAPVADLSAVWHWRGSIGAAGGRCLAGRPAREAHPSARSAQSGRRAPQSSPW